jgi:hypothetical protein
MSNFLYFMGIAARAFLYACILWAFILVALFLFA